MVLLFCVSLLSLDPGFRSRRKRLGRYFLYFALIQPQNAMAPSCKRKIMGSNQRRQLMVSVQFCHQFKNHLTGASVEIAGRLVSQQDLWPGNERPCQCKTLLLSTGKLSRTMMPAGFESDLAQPSCRFGFGGSQSLSASEQRHGDILKSGEFREKVVKLPHIADFAVTKFSCGILGKRIHLGICAVYGTRGGTIKSGKDVQQGTLAGSGLPDDREHRAFLDLERQILKEHEFCVA